MRILKLGLAGFLLGLPAPSGILGQSPAAAPIAADPLIAQESAHPSGFPRILVLDAPGSALVTFRLSVPIDPGIDAATVAPILLTLAEDRIRGSAATLGAQIEVGSSASALSFTVTGALVDLDHLTYLLRQATAAPRASEGFAAARTALEDQLTRIGETGEGRVESELRGQAAQGEASVAEVRNRLRRLEFADVERVWSDSHRPPRMTLVVVGDVATPVLLAALSGLGATPPPDPPSLPMSPTPPTPDRPDLLRQWSGFAWASTPTLDPRAVVAASLAARFLRADPSGYEAYVRLWEGRNQDVLAVIGSGYGGDATSLRRRLSSLPTDLAASLDATSVNEVVQRLHWTLLGQARTPWGRANLVGRFLDTGAAPDAARRYLDDLQALTVDDLRAYLNQLAATEPSTAEAGQ